LYLGYDYALPSWLSQSFSLSLNDEFSSTISIPILGDFSCKTKLPVNLPIKFEEENGKFIASIGFNKNIDIGAASTIKDLMNIQEAMSKTSGSLGPLPVTYFSGGYVEGYFDKEAKPHLTDSGLRIAASGGLNFTQQVSYYPVPVFITWFELAGEADSRSRPVIGESGRVSVNTTLDATLTLSSGPGIGIWGYGFSGGISATGHVVHTFVNNACTSAYLTLTFKLCVIKYTGLIFEVPWEIIIPPQTWDLMSNSKNPDPELEVLQEIARKLLDTSSYKRQNIDYLKTGSAFRMRSNPTGFVDNAYQNAAPQLLTWTDGRMLAVWIGYDQTRNGYDGLCLHASYYDGSTWSEPFQVEDDGTMDGAPTVTMIGDRALVAWQDANAHIPDDIEMDEIGALIDLSVAVFDPQTQSFSTTRITDDGMLDMQPALGGYYTVTEDSTETMLTVAWICNENNEWFNNTGGNQIKRVTGSLELDSSDKLLFVPDSQPVIVDNGCNIINSLAVYHSGRTPHVMWCMSTGESKNEAADMVMYEDGVLVENDEKTRMGIQIVNGRKYWIEDDGLYCDGELILSEIPFGRIQALEENGIRAILYQKCDDGLYGTIYAIMYDNAGSAWGSPIAISSGTCGIASFSAAVGANGIELMVNEFEVVEDEEGIQHIGTASISLYNLPLHTDLRLTDVVCETKYYDPNSDVSVELSLENVGLITADAILVRMLDENGNQLASETYSVFLLPGQSITLPFTYYVSDYQPGIEVTFEALPVGQEDAVPDDNTGKLTFLYRDILLRNTSWGYGIDEQTYVLADVVNEGHETLQNVTVSLRKDTADGPVVDTATVTELERFVAQRIAFSVEYEEGAVYFMTIEDAEDANSANDKDFVVLYEQTESFGVCELFGGHIWDEGELVSAPSVAGDGEFRYTCHRCGKTRSEAVAFLFDDVQDQTAYYFAPVYWAVRNGITFGTTDTTFSPRMECTRAQFLTMLWRANGSPAPQTATEPFEDVDEEDYYYPAVLWAYENGIAAGVEDTRFGAKQPCTRAQAVTFLWRLAGAPDMGSTENPFADVKKDSFCYDAVLWAYQNQITSGTAANAFSPNTVGSRAQLLTFLYRATAN
jgi:hypothetical protein